MPDPSDLEARLRQLRPAAPPPLRRGPAVPRQGARLPRLAAAALLLAAGLGFWSLRSGKGDAARVLAAEGMALKPGDALAPGAALSLPPGASLSLALPDGSRLDLSGGARGTLGPGRGPEGILSLEEGYLRCQVAHGQEAFLVRTPLGEVRDRGTVFTIDIRNPRKQEKETVMKHGKALAAGAVVTVAVVSGWIEFRQTRGTPVPAKAGEVLTVRSGEAPAVAPLAEELEALRARNAALKRQVAALGKAAPEEATSAVPKTPGPAMEALAAQARAALKARDVQAFSDAFLALLDAGEPAWPAVTGLIQEMYGSGENRAWLDNDSTAMRRFQVAFLSRAPKLGGLADAILAREGEPDETTNLAFYLFDMGARSPLPRDGRVALFLSLLRKANASGSKAEEVMRRAAVLLGELKATEALPEIERMILDRPDAHHEALLEGIAKMDGPEALASARRMLARMGDASASQPNRQMLLRILALCVPGREASDLLWDIVGKETDGDFRSQLLADMARRGEDVDRIVQEIRDPRLGEEDRQQILEGLAQTQQPQALWTLYESEPALQDNLLQAMLEHGDPKATEILFQRLKSGQITEKLADGLKYVDAEKNAESLRTLAANAAMPVSVRIKSSNHLLMSGDREILGALMTGFPGLPDQDRLQVIQCVGVWARGTEAKAVLERIAASDPSQAVRDAASSYLKH